VTIRRLVWPLVVVLTLAGMVFVFFLPARTLMQQRADLAATETRIRVLSTQSAKLSSQVDRLHSQAEIERLAREQYGLVLPGEEAYAILPAPQAPAPPAPPRRPNGHHRGLLSRVWHDVSFWS
jgi:cell division protein FtsB